MHYITLTCTPDDQNTIYKVLLVNGPKLHPIKSFSVNILRSMPVHLFMNQKGNDCVDLIWYIANPSV